MERVPLIFGLDSNVLCYALDPSYSEHSTTVGLVKNLSDESVAALSPTVIHETYHTLVFARKLTPDEASLRLKLLMSHPHIVFMSQTKRTTLVALSLATKAGLGGRDALICACCLTNGVPVLYTRDKDLLRLNALTWRDTMLELVDPLTSRLG